MGKFAVGSIVLVTFPFSNLSGQKVRPALVLANSEFGNVILCQITSRSYSSKISICIKPSNFTSGKLPVTCYVRPDKLFTADTTIIRKTVGHLNASTRRVILSDVRALFI